PASLSECLTKGIPFAAIAINVVSALTTTSTQYDDYVHTQAASSSTGKQSTPAQNSAATPTTKPNSIPSTTPLAAQTLQLTSNTPAPNSAPVVISGTTITPGAPAVTIGGTTYSLAASSSVLVVDGSTLTPEATLTATSGGGVGSLIWSGIGGTEGSTTLPGGSATGSGARVVTFTGAANRLTGGMDWRYWLAVSLVAVLAAWQ